MVKPIPWRPSSRARDMGGRPSRPSKHGEVGSWPPWYAYHATLVMGIVVEGVFLTLRYYRTAPKKIPSCTSKDFQRAVEAPPHSSGERIDHLRLSSCMSRALIG